MNEVAKRSLSLKKAAAISSCGAIDLSHEMIHRDGFKSLSWWEERGTWEVHAFLAVGVISKPLMQVEGITPVLQFSDWLPWLDLKAIADGDIQSMDVFADNELDWGPGDFAGIYLGTEKLTNINGQVAVAHQLLNRCHSDLNRNIEKLLWGLWGQAPYAYSAGTPYDERSIKSAHQLTLSDDEMTLVTKSVTLV